MAELIQNTEGPQEFKSYYNKPSRGNVKGPVSLTFPSVPTRAWVSDRRRGDNGKLAVI